MIPGATATAVAGVVLCKETCLGAAASATSIRVLSRQLMSRHLSQSVACAAIGASQNVGLLSKIAHRLLCANDSLVKAGMTQETCNADPHATVCSMCLDTCSLIVAMNCMIETFVM